jgi:hypothetical protein
MKRGRSSLMLISLIPISSETFLLGRLIARVDRIDVTAVPYLERDDDRRYILQRQSLSAIMNS